MAELFLGLISALSKSVLRSVTSAERPESEERVMSSLEESLPQSPSEVLGVDGDDSGGGEEQPGLCPLQS